MAKTYHKEDLRADLLGTALRHVAEHGHQTLSLRAIAQAVGVSTAAPYHHFADRRALLLALADDGYARLVGTARTIAAGGQPLPERLQAVGEGFLQFTRDQPRLVELMYESELCTPVIEPAIVAWQVQAYDMLTGLMREISPELAPDVLALRVIAFWSAIYGYAMLRAKAMLGPFLPDRLSEQAIDAAVVRQAVEAALQGAAGGPDEQS